VHAKAASNLQKNLQDPTQSHTYMFEAWRACVKKQSRLLSLVEGQQNENDNPQELQIMPDQMSNAL
jgi:hypothetical protein